MRRLLLLILGFLATWLGATLPAVAAAELPTHPEFVHAYTYDSVGAAAPYDTSNERGPPTGDYIARDAADHGSCGASACQYAPTAPITYRYDHPIKFVQIAPGARTIERSDGVAHGASVVDRGRVAANAGDDLTRVGRWMSQSEYDQMVKSSRVIEGGGGRTYVVRPPNPETYKPGKGVYAEFDVPTSSLHPAGGNPNYAVIPGPNAGTTRFGPLPTQMPRATCIELVCRR